MLRAPRVIGVILLTLSIPVACKGPDNDKPQKPTTPSRLVVEPDHLKSGETITVYGSGFCVKESCSNVTIRFAGEEPVKEVKLSSDGSFAVSFPAFVDPGRYQIEAVQMEGKRQEKIRVLGDVIVGVGGRKPRSFMKEIK